MMKRPLRSFTLVLMLVVMLFALPGIPAGAQTQSTIRVWLKRLQITDTLEIEVHGNYMLEDGSMTFSDGAQITVLLRENQLVLHAGQMAVVMGPHMRLVRCEGEIAPALRLAGSDGLYEGDLLLTISDGVIRPVLHIFIETLIRCSWRDRRRICSRFPPCFQNRWKPHVAGAGPAPRSAR